MPVPPSGGKVGVGTRLGTLEQMLPATMLQHCSGQTLSQAPPPPSPFPASSWVTELAMPMLDQHVLLDDVIFWSLPSYTHPLKTAASLL